MVELKKFGASWCGPCRTLAPILSDIKSQYDNVSFMEYDVDESFDEATKYSIRSVPTVIVLKNGEEVERLVGLSPKQKYIEVINKTLNN